MVKKDPKRLQNLKNETRRNDTDVIKFYKVQSICVTLHTSVIHGRFYCHINSSVLKKVIPLLLPEKSFVLHKIMMGNHGKNTTVLHDK